MISENTMPIDIRILFQPEKRSGKGEKVSEKELLCFSVSHEASPLYFRWSNPDLPDSPFSYSIFPAESLTSP